MSGKAITNPVTLARIRQLRTDRDNANAAWDKHRKICAKCARVGLLSENTCEDGWELAKKRARARNRWANREAISQGGYQQTALFDVPHSR